VDNSTPPLNAANLNHNEVGIQTATSAISALAGKYGHILIDDCTGADDDAKLTTALTAAAAATYPPVIQFANKQYTFTTRGRAPYEGLRLQGPVGFNLPERNSQTKMSNRIHLNFDSSSDGAGWFHQAAGNVFQVAMDNLSLTGGGTQASFLTCASDSTQWFALYLRDISSTGLRTLLGRQAQALAGTACYFDGNWEINNSYNGAIHVKGSDFSMWTGGNLQIDSGTSFNSTGSANGQFHVWFDFCDKATVGPMYMTAEGGWNGVKVSGPSNPRTSTSNNTGRVMGAQWRVEGRNKAAACNGSLIRIEGGSLSLSQAWTSYAMVSPSTPGHSPADAGVIHMENGILHLWNTCYDRATGVGEDTADTGFAPLLYNNAGKAYVNEVEFTSGGGTWVTGPRYKLAGGGTIVTDGTITAAS
jgi:hypothetical protein